MTKHNTASKMENTSIKNHAELVLRLAELRSEKESQELIVKCNFTDFISSIDLVSFFKRSGTTNNGETHELLKTSLNMVLNLLTGLVLGKNRSIKGYLSSLMVERFTTMVIDNNLINIVAGIGSMIFKNKKQDNNPS
jgi:hypothetical protein